MAQRTLSDIQRETRMITTPGDWPNWPILPLKHRHKKFADDDSLGFILAVEAPPYTVYTTLMYFLKPGKTWGERVAGLPSTTYGTLPELIAEWQVD